MAPFSPASGVPATLPETWSLATQRAALLAAAHLPASASAIAARPVLLVLLVGVDGPPRKLPLAFCCRASQVAPLVIARRTLAVGRASDRRLVRATAVASGSGALSAREPASQPCAAVVAGAKIAGSSPGSTAA